MLPERGLRGSATRVAAVAAALYLTVGLGWLVRWPDDRPLVGVVRVTALVVGWVGAYGVVRERGPVVEMAALALALLGFWQPVAWVVVLPAGAALAVAAAVLARSADDDAGSDADADDGSAGPSDRSAGASAGPAADGTAADGEPADGE